MKAFANFKASALMQLWTRLKFPHFLSVSVSRVVLKLLDRYAIPSYSQFGEDRLIDSILGWPSQGFYVDVGCNHPIRGSNTYKLYLRGWRGLAIDGNPDIVKIYTDYRPQDTVVSKAVALEKGLVDFFITKSSDATSGIGSKTEGNWQRTEANSNVIKIAADSLDNILKEHDVPGKFELLSIDTEGNEFDVLKSMNFNEFQPMVIAVEIHGFNMEDVKSSPIYQELSQFGYRIVGLAGPTVIFCHK